MEENAEDDFFVWRQFFSYTCRTLLFFSYTCRTFLFLFSTDELGLLH
jgi:hypothetical protein